MEGYFKSHENPFHRHGVRSVPQYGASDDDQKIRVFEAIIKVVSQNTEKKQALHCILLCLYKKRFSFLENLFISVCYYDESYGCL